MEYLTQIFQSTTVNSALVIALVSIGCDLCSGVIKALYLNDFKSSVLRKGLYGKLEWIILFLASYVIYLVTGINEMIYVVVITCTFTELMSILENMIQMGLIQNEFVTKFFRVTNETNKDSK